MRTGELRLTRDGDLLAILRPDRRQLFSEYPSVESAYETAPAFEPLRHLFEREAELLNVDNELENAEWADIWDHLRAPGMFVETPDGRERIDVLWIHFKDGRAWWFPLYNSPRTVLKK